MPSLTNTLVQLAPFVDPLVVSVGWVLLLIIVIAQRPRLRMRQLGAEPLGVAPGWWPTG